MRQPDELDVGNEIDLATTPFYIASKEGTQKQIDTAKQMLEYAKIYIQKQKSDKL